MRQVPEKLRELVEPVVTGLGYEAVGIEYLQQGADDLLRVYIDHADGITVDDCGAVSHQLSGVLDVEDPIAGHYTLEVSSPGIDRPLFRIGDYARFAGRRVKLRLVAPRDGRARYTGELRGVDGEEIIVDVDGEEQRFAFVDVDRARLVGETGPRRG